MSDEELIVDGENEYSFRIFENENRYISNMTKGRHWHINVDENDQRIIKDKQLLRYRLDNVDITNLWFNNAWKQPTKQTLVVQLGCCLEEIGELLDSIKILNYTNEHADSLGMESLKNLSVKELATQLKAIGKNTTDLNVNNVEFLDALGDIVVTVVGLFNALKRIDNLPEGLQFSEILEEINYSNFSKFDENGNPEFDENGKIKKSSNYEEPDIKQFLNE